MNEKEIMQRCIELAAMGLGRVLSNPLVGCVILKDGKVIGEGFHKEYGKEHAEINAINSVKNKNDLFGSTMFVTLEPCSHYGKTPPCIESIIKSKIKEVIIASKDPNPIVNGKGISKLLENNIEVKVGILEDEYRFVNRRYFTFIEKKRPYIILKWAQSVDGFITEPSGKKWFTSNNSKMLVHKWRAEEMAILVGSKTVENDNPYLTVRLIKGNNPIRIIITNHILQTDLNVFDSSSKTIVVTQNINVFNYYSNLSSFINSNKEVVYFDKSTLLLKELLSLLYERKIISIIVEGGLYTLERFLELDLYDECRIFITNKEFKNGIKAPAVRVKNLNYFKVGNDTLLTMYNF